MLQLLCSMKNRLCALLIISVFGLNTYAQIGSKYSRFNQEMEVMVDPALAPFYHGVASGDPLHDRVIIWTRVTPDSNFTSNIPVTYKLFRDVNLSQKVKEGVFITNENRDFTVKIDVTGLEESTTYYFTFEALGKTSIIGRTRTAPKQSVEHLKFAIVSCSDYENGFFNAYRQIARTKDLDAVFHLGDYQYEYAASEGVGGRKYEPDGETITLSDYRIRHSITKLDPDVRDAHQQHPWMVVWDDHESTNNSYRDGAQNHTEGTEGVWAERKEFAAKAYDEWMPIRLMEENKPIKIWRTVNYGNLLDIILLDTRIYDRDEQLADAVQSDVNDPNRKIIGPEQMEFLKNALKNSTAKWKVIAQQVMFMQWNIVGKPIIDEIQQAGDLVNMVVNENGVAFNSDAWDGYPAERKAILQFIQDENIDNVIVLTGDIHSSWASDLSLDPMNPADYNPVTGAGSLAVEFVTNSVTSSNLDAAVSNDQLGAAELAVRTGIMATNPHIKWNNLFNHGYSVLNITPTKTHGDFYLTRKDISSDEQSREAGFSTEDGANHLVSESAAYPNKPNAPELAPFFVSTSIKNQAQKIGGEILILGVYPNPFSNTAQLQIVVNKAQSKVQYSMYDVTGKTVQSKSLSFNGGLHHVDIDANNLKRGVYYVHLLTEQSNDITKVIVK
jgi:alkaline phosphatase D